MVTLKYIDAQGDKMTIAQEDLEGACGSARSALRLGATAVTIETDGLIVHVSRVDRRRGDNVA